MRQSIIILLLFVSIVSFGQRNRDRDKEKIEEDLSKVRPRYEDTPDTSAHFSGNPVRNVAVVRPTMTVNQKVDNVLDSTDELNALRKFAPGYTIQVYSGLNREEAGNARMRIQSELDMRADLQYIQPKFRVRVGYYFTTLDAQKDLVKLRRAFPNAVLVPENIPIK